MVFYGQTKKYCALALCGAAVGIGGLQLVLGPHIRTLVPFASFVTREALRDNPCFRKQYDSLMRNAVFGIELKNDLSVDSPIRVYVRGDDFVCEYSDKGDFYTLVGSYVKPYTLTSEGELALNLTEVYKNKIPITRELSESKSEGLIFRLQTACSTATTRQYRK